MDLINNTDKFIKNVKLGTKDTKFLKFEEVEQNENITKHFDLSEIHKKNITYSITYELCNGKSVVANFDVYENKYLEYRHPDYKSKKCRYKCN